MKFSSLKTIFIHCTLKKTGRQSHTEGLMQCSMNIMEKEGVALEYLRLADYDIPVGLQPDMTQEGEHTDDWPLVYQRIMDADILVMGTPVWLGARSPMASKCIERLYAMSAGTNHKKQYAYYGKVGGCVITGNEDGIKHTAMNILYTLQHLGFSIPPQADCGWVGEAPPGPSYLDEESGARGAMSSPIGTPPL